MNLDHSMTVWFPIVTLLLGYILSSISESVRHRRTLEREREAREAERRDKALEPRATFQPATLLEIQDGLIDLKRTSRAHHHQDINALNRTGAKQKTIQ